MNQLFWTNTPARNVSRVWLQTATCCPAQPGYLYQCCRTELSGAAAAVHPRWNRVTQNDGERNKCMSWSTQQELRSQHDEGRLLSHPRTRRYRRSSSFVGPRLSIRLTVQ